MNTTPPMNPEVARLRRKAAERKYRQRVRIVRLLWATAGLLLLVLFIEGLIALGFSPRFWVYRIEVRQAETLTNAEVIRRMALPRHSSYFRAPLGRLARRIETEPRVAQAWVRRGELGVLVADVQERTAVCRLGFTAPPIYLDAAGIAFTRPVPPESPVPVLEGVVPKTLPVLGKVVALKPVTQTLACLRALRETAKDRAPLAVSRVVVGLNGGFTLILPAGTKVFLGAPERFPLKLWMLQQAVLKASQDGYSLNRIKYFDVRYVTDQSGKGVAMRPKDAQE
jgi:cell division septal protein FtsQ